MHFKNLPSEQCPKVYLVGGAVRDKQCGQPVAERDWVVVNATPQIMLDAGFKTIGKDFPVFLHPETKEEYALARTERKTGRGHTGFTCKTNPNVTLEDDLRRRDLTINAMAETLSGKLIDPYGGLDDLRQGILRHVSPAFTEDPLRILRTARFAAMLHKFQVHPHTCQLMKNMVAHGELSDIATERVITELTKALRHPNYHRFFQVLEDCQALAYLFPKLTLNSTIRKALQPINLLIKKYHPKEQSILRFSVIFHTLIDEQRKKLYQHYSISQTNRALTELLVKYKHKLASLLDLSAGKQLELLYDTDALRRPERFTQLITLVQGLESTAPSSLQYESNKLIQLVQKVDKTQLINKQLTGKAFKKALIKLQQQALEDLYSGEI